uniref:putative disease resistance protein At3g14460 n=1 Tax=Erigeron canadensis TaxID=72917 RepID=UPI001CB8DD93|nr:putative disease resistance protein At3g14460 [Erigeron canadensis]
MATIIAAALLQVVFQKLADEGLKRFAGLWGIQSEINNLGNTLSKIQDLLNDASDKEIADKNVKQWLNSLQHLAYDIDDLLDDLATDGIHREFNSKVRNLIPNFKLKLRRKLDSIATKLQELEKEKVNLGLIKKDKKPSSRRNETSFPDSCKILGREGEKMELLHKLLGDEKFSAVRKLYHKFFKDEKPCKEKFGVVPIVGMGGVGKTTLARSLYNETKVKNHFKLRAWVCVSDDFDVFKISETIYKEIASETKKFDNLNQLQVALSEQLKEKRFLLVLDDIWSEKYVDWENLVKPFHVVAHGSKIIMTTRKEGLLKQIGFSHLDKLDTLSHDAAMSLLARNALNIDNFDSHMDLKLHGEGIVKICGCLPLAIKIIGRLLRTTTNEQDWENVLNSKIWQTDDNIVPALRLSYQELSASLKQLFAYCSFFPKGFVFDKDELVMLWMAEGFLHESIGSKLTYECLGHKHFDELLSRSFFQIAPNEKSGYVMHDLIIDLATFVAEDFFLKFDNQMEIKTKTLAKYRHMSFIRERYVGYEMFKEVKSAKSLRTFMAVSVGVKKNSDCFYLSNKILVDLLPELQLLRVLCLNNFEISEVPECIGRLKHLRYLNLSQTKIKDLPENVGNLYNLQSLICFGCDKLRNLPKSFSKLKNLRHFDIRDTPLVKQMPSGIDGLDSLRTLTKVIIEGDDGFTITKLKPLKNLMGKISIEGLGKVQNAMHAREASLSEKRLSEVNLIWDDVSNDFQKETLENKVLNELKPYNDTLKKLRIVSYRGIKFPIWVGDPSFNKLVHVSISDCRKCTSLPLLGMLQSLKELHIKGMDAIEVIGSELLGTGGDAFHSLEILSFQYMFGWSTWSTDSGILDTVFPCLREIYIKGCPKLVDISLKELPSLRTLRIDDCGDVVLRSMVSVASSVTKLVINNIAGLTDKVWRGVIKNIGGVEEVWVYYCSEIRYMWKSEKEASKVLVNLRRLEVNGCLNLVSLGEKEHLSSNVLTSLIKLVLEDCDNLKDCNCPANVERLNIRNCRSIACVSFPTREQGEGMHKLKSLTIRDCEQLVVGKEFMNWEEITNNALLERLDIRGWPNLKSMSGLLSCYTIHLTNLIISDCKNLESLELPNLPSLTHLTILNCPSTEGCFQRGHWPSKLTSLAIGGLKKSISEWGPGIFPSSLVNLTLLGTRDEVSELSPHLFPSNLATLKIWDFEKLKTVSVGLQDLTSLQHLQIRFCPNLRDLPEKLLPLLLSLEIDECRKLKEKTSKGGRGWHKISHIPCIKIDKELQN